MVEKSSSDLHVTCGSPPQLRIDGRLVPLRAAPLTAEDTRQLCYSFLTESQKQQFEENNELDASFGVKGLSRFRANLFMMRGSVSATFRSIPSKIHGFKELGLPPMVEYLAARPNGLILVTGPTGSGKSTTLAAIVDKINRERRQHILTIEDPIEYLHPHKNCIVNQREVGADTKSFLHALRYILRQDPDIVLIGEMRDLETVDAALKIAETGHLCMATLHTNGAISSLNRMIDMFPPHHQSQVRSQLSFCFEGVLSQQLIPTAKGGGRVMACEAMVTTPAIKNLIRENKLHQIYTQMQVGQTKYGMQTMNQSLVALLQRGLITVDDALSRSSDMEEIRVMISKVNPSPQR